MFAVTVALPDAALVRNRILYEPESAFPFSVVLHEEMLELSVTPLFVTSAMVPVAVNPDVDAVP